MKVYEIPGFSRYYVRMPFEIISRWSGKPIGQFKRKTLGRGAPFVTLISDDYGRVQRSIYTVAALAFHGQQPVGYEAWCIGEAITPKTVKWQPVSRINGTRFRKLNGRQQELIEIMYWEQGKTQTAIAEKIGVAQSTVSRTLNWKLKTAKARV